MSTADFDKLLGDYDDPKPVEKPPRRRYKGRDERRFAYRRRGLYAKRFQHRSRHSRNIHRHERKHRSARGSYSSDESRSRSRSRRRSRRRSRSSSRASTSSSSSRSSSESRSRRHRRAKHRRSRRSHSRSRSASSRSSRSRSRSNSRSRPHRGSSSTATGSHRKRPSSKSHTSRSSKRSERSETSSGVSPSKRPKSSSSTSQRKLRSPRKSSRSVSTKTILQSSTKTILESSTKTILESNSKLSESATSGDARNSSANAASSKDTVALPDARSAPSVSDTQSEVLASGKNSESVHPASPPNVALSSIASHDVIEGAHKPASSDTRAAAALSPKEQSISSAGVILDSEESQSTSMQRSAVGESVETRERSHDTATAVDHNPPEETSSSGDQPDKSSIGKLRVMLPPVPPGSTTIETSKIVSAPDSGLLDNQVSRPSRSPRTPVAVQRQRDSSSARSDAEPHDDKGGVPAVQASLRRDSVRRSSSSSRRGSLESTSVDINTAPSVPSPRSLSLMSTAFSQISSVLRLPESFRGESVKAPQTLLNENDDRERELLGEPEEQNSIRLPSTDSEIQASDALSANSTKRKTPDEDDSTRSEFVLKKQKLGARLREIRSNKSELEQVIKTRKEQLAEKKTFLDSVQRSKKIAQETIEEATAEVAADDCVVSEMNNEVEPPAGQTSLSEEQWIHLPVWQRKILRENMAKQARSESILPNDMKPLVPRKDDIGHLGQARESEEHFDGPGSVFSVIDLLNDPLHQRVCVEIQRIMLWKAEKEHKMRREFRAEYDPVVENFALRLDALEISQQPEEKSGKVDVLGEEQPSARAKRHLVRLASDADKARLGAFVVASPASSDSDEDLDPVDYLKIHDPDTFYGERMCDVEEMPPVSRRRPEMYFEDRNRIVHDPILRYEEHKRENPWTPREQEIFLQNYVKYPKQFDTIAEQLPYKSVGDCVMHYYDRKFPTECDLESGTTGGSEWDRLHERYIEILSTLGKTAAMVQLRAKDCPQDAVSSLLKELRDTTPFDFSDYDEHKKYIDVYKHWMRSQKSKKKRKK